MSYGAQRASRRATIGPFFRDHTTTISPGSPFLLGSTTRRVSPSCSVYAPSGRGRAWCSDFVAWGSPPESGKVPCTLLLHAGIGVLDGHNRLLPCVARLGVHRRRVIWICSHRRPLIRAVDGQGGGAVSAASPSAYGLILASCEYLGSTRGQCASWWAGVKWGASNSGRVETCTNGTPHYWTMTFLQ